MLPSVGCKCKQRQFVDDRDFLSLIENMEVTGNIPVLALEDRNIVE